MVKAKPIGNDLKEGLVVIYILELITFRSPKRSISFDSHLEHVPAVVHWVSTTWMQKFSEPRLYQRCLMCH